MPTIYFNNIKFHSRGSSATREHEYEAAILSDTNRLFTDLIVHKFKFDLSNGIETKRPDLIYVTKDYSKWGFIEVELSHHSIKDHILPQIEVIASSTPPISKIIDFHAQSGLNRDNLTSLFKFEPPQNYIIIDRHVDGLAEEAYKFDFRVCILEIFESISGEIAIRQNGYNLPSINRSESYLISQTRRVGIFKATRIFDSIDRIVYLDRIFDCEVFIKGDVSWLIIKDFTYAMNDKIKLVKSSSGLWLLISGDSYV